MPATQSLLKSSIGSTDKEGAVFKKLVRNFLLCAKNSFDAQNSKTDCCWWYGERSLTGLLAAAAWLIPTHGWSLEEFTGERSRGKRKPAKGRGDLWILVGSTEKRGALTIEAKVTWPEQIEDVSKWVDRVNKKLGKAFGQLKSLQVDYHYGRPAAVCYVVPAVPKGTSTANARKLSASMKHFIEAMTNDAPRTIVAAVWTRDFRNAPSDGWNGRKSKIRYLYPGVAIVIRYKNSWRFSKKLA